MLLLHACTCQVDKPIACTVQFSAIKNPTIVPKHLATGLVFLLKSPYSFEVSVSFNLKQERRSCIDNLPQLGTTAIGYRDLLMHAVVYGGHAVSGCISQYIWGPWWKHQQSRDLRILFRLYRVSGVYALDSNTAILKQPMQCWSRILWTKIIGSLELKHACIHGSSID